MRDFSIFCDFDLSVKPNWLDSFRAKYDDPLPYHFTLKNSTYLENMSEEVIKSILQQILHSHFPSSCGLVGYFMLRLEWASVS